MPRVALGVAQPVDAVAHARGPWCRRSSRARPPPGRSARSAASMASAVRSSASSQEMRSNWPEPFGPLRRSGCMQPVGMVDALGVARDLGADDAGRVAVVLGAAHAADACRRAAARPRARRSRGSRAGRPNGRSRPWRGRSWGAFRANRDSPHASRDRDPCHRPPLHAAAASCRDARLQPRFRTRRPPGSASRCRRAI